MINWRDTVISQFANSDTILQIISDFNDNVDPSVNIDNFYNFVWNIATAKGYGLDVWGRIVVVSRVLSLPSPTDFGFAEGAAPSFGLGTFYSTANATNNFSLSDTAYRTLILIKALVNISRASMQTLNTVLRQLFAGRGNCYVSDLGGMRARLTFEFVLHPFELAILRQSGVFAGPTGVELSIIQLELPLRFGFAEAGAHSSAPFGYGTFFGDPVNAI